MRSLIVLLLIIVIPLRSFAAVQRTGLKAALEKGMVKLSAVSTGAVYSGKALRMQLTNNTRDALQITVEPALIFRPSDTSYQDLVLPGTEMIALAPGGSGELTVQTFCGKANASAPSAKLDYAFKKQGDSVMIKVLRYISKHQLFDNLGQHAVWVLTDNHSLEGLMDPARPKVSSDLLALMVQLTGRRVPLYFKQFRLNTAAGQPVFDNKLLKIISKLEWKLDSPKALTMGIYNERGDLVQHIFKEKELTPGLFKMQVEFEAENAPAGKYFLRLKDGETVMKELMVEVD